MKLLILNSAILAAGDLTETADTIETDDAIYPKHVIAGYEVVDVEVPEDFTPARYEYHAGVLVKRPEPKPAVAVPTSVSMRQARLALLNAGLLDDVEAVISAAGRAAQIEWEYATEVSRDHPIIAIVQQQQGLADDQIDDLFRAGGAL